MSINNITLINEKSVEPESYLPSKEKILKGNPAQLIWHCYDNKDETFGAGIWQGEPGSHKVNYTEEEVCFLLQGKVILHDNDGKTIELNQGDMFAIPAGFSGVWETVETAKKMYVVYEQ